MGGLDLLGRGRHALVRRRPRTPYFYLRMLKYTRRYMTLGRCPLGIFCCRSTPPRVCTENALDGRIGPVWTRPPRPVTAPPPQPPTFRGFNARICTGNPLDGRVGKDFDGRIGQPLDGRIGYTLNGCIGYPFDGRIGHLLNGRIENHVNGRIGPVWARPPRPGTPPPPSLLLLGGVIPEFVPEML